ncbi:hypothetical protein C1H46_032631 [Malus baccata]|uniref:Uncharacterized protein n=1 Tax=Malus baccata TaxID=106549 RepID=A0A540L5U0_MALBA|nr:hypothetical protein C1H46_032631 [Malus baccata]
MGVALRSGQNEPATEMRDIPLAMTKGTQATIIESTTESTPSASSVRELNLSDVFKTKNGPVLC